MKNYSTLGIVAGLVLAFFIHLGLWPTVLAVLLAALGGVIGAHFGMESLARIKGKANAP